MKRKLWAAWLLTSLLLPWGALAQETFDGTVVAGEAVAITAPFSTRTRPVPFSMSARMESAFG